jgi:LysR family transcriptional regulator of abg operon
MKLNQLRDVLAVAEAGTFRGASRRLGIAQSAITRSIREIEHELGVPLFERHTKGVRVTRIGEIFLRRAVTVQNELRKARDEVEHFKQNSTGEVSLALSGASAIGLLHSILPPFRRRFPDAVIKLSEGLFQIAEAGLMSGESDLYVGPLDTSITSTLLAVEHLFGNKRLIFARAGHPLSQARTLAELADAEWVRPTFSVRYTEGDFAEMFEAAGLRAPKVVIHARSALLAVLAVTGSDLLTVLPRQWVELPNMLGAMAPIELDLALDAAPVCIVRRTDLPPTPMAEYLTDLIRRTGLEYGRRQLAQS